MLGELIAFRMRCFACVWKSLKKYHSTLRAKRATFTILRRQKLTKNAKKWQGFEKQKLAVKQSYQTCQFKIGQKLVHFGVFLKIWSLRSNSVTRQVNSIYFISRQKFNKNAKNGPFWRDFEKTKACGQIVLPDRSL